MIVQAIKRWFRNPRPKCTTITIAIDKPNVVVSVDWADPENLTSQEIAEEASRTVKTILAITNGDGPGLNEIQRAMCKNADLRKDQGMANAIYSTFRDHCHSKNSSASLDDRLMSADQVFPAIS